MAIFVGAKNKGVRLLNRDNLSKLTEINIRGFNLKQKKALQNLELCHMKDMVVEKMKTKKKQRKQRVKYPNGVRINVLQTNIVSKGKTKQILITCTWSKSYANDTFPKRTYLRNTLIRLTKDKILKQIDDRSFRKATKYFTMPYGFQTSHVLLLKSKFNYLTTRL